MRSESNHRKYEFILSAEETENIPGSAWKKLIIINYIFLPNEMLCLVTSLFLQTVFAILIF